MRSGREEERNLCKMPTGSIISTTNSRTATSSGWGRKGVAAELLKRYAEKLYDYSKRQFIEPRLEIQELTQKDENIPKDGEEYVFNVDADDETLINHIQYLRTELAKKASAGKVIPAGDIRGLNFEIHLYQPLFHLKKQGEISIQPVSLNDSEFRFVTDLCEYVKKHKADFQLKGQEVFLLRNMSRGKGVGFAEASNFHPDFILWLVEGEKQYITLHLSSRMGCCMKTPRVTKSSLQIGLSRFSNAWAIQMSFSTASSSRQRRIRVSSGCQGRSKDG